MLTLGLAGGLDPVHAQVLDSAENYTYDGAAVLLEDGEVIAAVEEERLNRIRHSNKFPIQAIRHCLQERKVALSDLDSIAYYAAEPSADALLSALYLARPALKARPSARALFAHTLGTALGCAVDPGKLRFYEHRLTHAAGALAQSGFDESLVLVLDNIGGLWLGRATGSLHLDSLMSMPQSKSLQRLSSAVTGYLGLSLFEEYLAVALAGEGRPERYRDAVGALYELLPNGEYVLRLERSTTLSRVIEPRRAGEPPTQAHRDLAAALQQAMERIVLHVLEYQRVATGRRTLCLSGGMAENSSTNGCIIRSGLFDDVFVHPAAYDAGCALGAAILAFREADRREGPSPAVRTKHVYWGPALASDDQVRGALTSWRGVLGYESSVDLVERGARLLAGGARLAWVRGRSEFGCHPLGNRCLLADPRSSAQREKVHAALGRSERYRPLGIALPEELAPEWFELPNDGSHYPFMNTAHRVRAEKAARLCAGTDDTGHVRLQTVSRQSNERFWQLLHAFGRITGVPALGVTSFNISVEPTVETVEDAIVAFATTELDALVVGEWLVTKPAHFREALRDWVRAARLSLPAHVILTRARGQVERTRAQSRDQLETSHVPARVRSISSGLASLLWTLNGEQPIRELLASNALGEPSQELLVSELIELWKERLVVISPGAQERGQS
ncbi:MAG TPA: carbamoyltransferase C-terminal domain-containing protein [Polyangiaceae bacterium]|nr:carbamoyltransferase C-terminal domain-containing protein [Polyangiaceae bacterium]